MHLSITAFFNSLVFLKIDQRQTCWSQCFKVWIWAFFWLSIGLMLAWGKGRVFVCFCGQEMMRANWDILRLLVLNILFNFQLKFICAIKLVLVHLSSSKTSNTIWYRIRFVCNWYTVRQSWIIMAAFSHLCFFTFSFKKRFPLLYFIFVLN